MATVRALTRCFFNYQCYEPGAEFPYDGPPRSCLQLVEGEWSQPHKGGEKDRLKSENEQLRARLAALEAEGKRRAQVAASTMPAADRSHAAGSGRKGKKAAPAADFLPDPLPDPKPEPELT